MSHFYEISRVEKYFVIHRSSMWIFLIVQDVDYGRDKVSDQRKGCGYDGRSGDCRGISCEGRDSSGEIITGG